MAALVSRVADALEDDVVRQSLIICGCALVAGAVLSRGASAQSLESMSKVETVVQAVNEADVEAHKESSSLYVPNDSYLLHLLKSETDSALEDRIKELESELANARKQVE